MDASSTTAPMRSAWTSVCSEARTAMSATRVISAMGFAISRSSVSCSSRHPRVRDAQRDGQAHDEDRLQEGGDGDDRDKDGNERAIHARLRPMSVGSPGSGTLPVPGVGATAASVRAGAAISRRAVAWPLRARSSTPSRIRRRSTIPVWGASRQVTDAPMIPPMRNDSSAGAESSRSYMGGPSWPQSTGRQVTVSMMVIARRAGVRVRTTA